MEIILIPTEISRHVHTHSFVPHHSSCAHASQSNSLPLSLSRVGLRVQLDEGRWKIPCSQLSRSAPSFSPSSVYDGVWGVLDYVVHTFNVLRFFCKSKLESWFIYDFASSFLREWGLFINWVPSPRAANDGLMEVKDSVQYNSPPRILCA